MTNIEKIEAEEAKQKRIIDNNYCCEVCKKRFGQSQLQLSHRIPKHKIYIRIYGAKVIHHRFNLALTCDKCNSSVLVNPHDNFGKDLIKKIEGDLIEDK